VATDIAQDTRKNGSNVVELVADRTVAPLKLEEFLPYRLAVLSSVVSRALSRMYARHDLGQSEWLVLMSLGESGPTTAKALGAKNQMHKTKVSRVVAELLKRELVARRPNQIDLREAFLELTPHGKGLYDECAPLAVEFVMRLGTAISPEDRQVLDRSLTRLAERAQKLISDPFDVALRQPPPG
jgi:DNA-binding MarR family transcriptional regulator